MADPITIEDFRKVELKTGKVTEASPHPNADRLLVLKVDIGNGEVRQVVSGIRAHYDPALLVGKNVVVVTNLPAALLRGIESQGMILAASNDPTLSIVTTEKEMPAGSKVS